MGLISKFMEESRTPHFLALKRILNYIKGTAGFGILYPWSSPNSEAELIGYTDVDWCGDKDDRKSTADYVFMLENSPISWCARKQSIIALSSCEAEYVACQALWLTTLMEELRK
jgi:hypothetical protein